MSWAMRQYEADLDYCEELHGRTDDDEEILEQIQDSFGKIDKKRVQAYLGEQTAAIENAERRIQEFHEEAQEARRMGASSRQIYGDGTTVSFTETQHMEIRRAEDNIKRCQEICMGKNIAVAVTKRQVTEHKISVREF